jgi:hypothetical protein
MRKTFKSVVAGVAALCVAGVISAVGATSAAAAAAPFDPTVDPNMVGTVTFYNAAGQVVTSGNGNDPLSAQYMVGSVTPAGALPTSRTTIQMVGPQIAVNPGLFSGSLLNGITIYPLPATAPAVVRNATTPQGAMLATSINMANAATLFTVKPAPLTNVFQVRLNSVGTVGPLYNATTITIDPVTGAWAQIDPIPLGATTTTLAASGSNPANAPASTTLTATVSPAAGNPVPAGTVQFFNGTTSLGTSPVTAGVAILPQSGVPAATYNLTAVFTPTDGVSGPSTSAPLAWVVQVPRPTPAVALTATSVAPNFGSSDTFTANVGSVGTPAVTPAGTIQFFNNGVSLGAAAATDATGMAVLTTSALTVGSHAVTATFVPTDLATYNGSTSPAVTVNVLAVQVGACATTPANCVDAKPFVATVPAGSLVISTPYTAAAPFNLGTMALNTAGTQYTTSNAFGSAANPAQGVTITDTRAGGLGWTASLQSGAFTNNTVLPVGIINGGNLGFAGVAPQYIAGNALNVAPGNVVSVFDNAAPVVALGSSAVAPALSLANPQKFASAAIGAGSVNVTGLFTLNAPSSVPAGLYAGTVTFTIA